MEKYNNLFNIKISNCGLINCKMSDPVYKFCINNKIKNLGDFINFYEINKIDMDRRYNFNYFDGIIDLIKLLYCDESLINNHIFMKKFEIKKYDKPFSHYVGIKGEKYNKSLRRLGFSNEEVKIILYYIFKYGKGISVMSALRLCLNGRLKIENNDKEDIIFLNKLNLLNNYMNKNLNKINESNDYKLDLLENKLNYLKSLYEEKAKLEKNINVISNDIKTQIDEISKYENIYVLRKKYNKIIEK